MPLPTIVPDLVVERARATPDRIAFCAPDAHDTWQPWTWSTFAARVARVAAALQGAGLGRGQRIAILAPTSMDWEVVQMAALALGVSVVGVDVNYPRALRDDVLRMVPISGLFVQDAATAASIPHELEGALRLLATFADEAEAPAPPARTLASLLDAASEAPALASLRDARPEDEALVVFSSGTTGQPKPIAYTHAQVLLAVRAILDAYPDIGADSRLLCWLPLANLFQRIVDFCGMACGATSYVISDPREVVRYLPRANPHLLIGVPRFFERLHAGIAERVRGAPRPVAALTARALAGGANRARNVREKGAQRAPRRHSARLIHRLIARRVRKVFGSSLRFVVSGSAPMPLWLLDWFDGIGVPVFEAYGVSENIVPVAMNRPRHRRAGSVGRPVAGQEVILADDGEILVRGPGVFGGYLTPPGAAAAGPDARGFWATGDYGEFDAQGFLRVTGRKSDAFKTATGRWVAPAAVEALLRRVPRVEHALLVGAGRQFVVALLAVDGTPATRGAGSTVSDAAAAGSEALANELRRHVAESIRSLPRHERPRGLLLTTRRFSLEGGELTANLKLRRRAVETHFAAAIAALFAALEARAQDARHGTGEETDALLVQWVDE